MNALKFTFCYLNWSMFRVVHRSCFSSLMAALMLLGGFVSPALAGDGHDHGDAPAAPAVAASPRVSGHSDLFELVGLLEGNELKIHLDRYATNEPVLDAKIEVEIGSIKGIAAAQADGTYSYKNDLFAKPGELAVSFTITSGKDTDLLAGELKIGSVVDDHAHHEAAKPWLRWAAYGGGAAALLVATFVVFRRRKSNASFTSNALVAVAVFAVVGAALASFDARAGDGHDHGDAPPAAANGNAPKRQADGGVFLPKLSQRQLGIRTVSVAQTSVPKVIELTGRVVADANAGGKVQPTQAGRVEAGPRGLPVLGQAVRKGEVLAVVRASASAMERANQQSQGTELKSSLELAKKRLARLEQLEGTVPAKDIEAAKLDVSSLQQRATAIVASVVSLEALVAPLAGVIAAANVVAGQVVDAREVLFEIVDPTRLSVEASAFDTSLLSNIAAASASPAAGTTMPLVFAGAGRVLREGAIPLLFKTTAQKNSGEAHARLAVGQPVKVLVQTKEQVKGFVVPAGAVVKNASNQDMVWVHTSAEVFQPRPSRVVPLDGAAVSVVDGLKAGDRVVTQGAPLVNQVR
jgi:membrane fusion protein, heavy metal efflux system